MHKFAWRHRTREVDFVVEVAGRLELFEAKWAEIPAAGDAVNLEFVRSVVGKTKSSALRSSAGRLTVIQLAEGVRTLPVT